MTAILILLGMSFHLHFVKKGKSQWWWKLASSSRVSIRKPEGQWWVNGKGQCGRLARYVMRGNLSEIWFVELRSHHSFVKCCTKCFLFLCVLPPYSFWMPSGNSSGFKLLVCNKILPSQARAAGVITNLLKSIPLFACSTAKSFCHSHSSLYRRLINH